LNGIEVAAGIVAIALMADGEVNSILEIAILMCGLLSVRKAVGLNE